MDMRQNISSGVRKSLFWKIHNKCRMHFCRDIILGHHKKKNKNRFNYCIEEWHTSSTYDIFRNQPNDTTVCLLLDTLHRNNNCITVCDKWIFDSNFEVAFPLTQDCLNYICRGNNADEIRFVGVSHAIRAFPPNLFKED